MLLLKIITNDNQVIYQEQSNLQKISELVRLQQVGMTRIMNIWRLNGPDTCAGSLLRYEIYNDDKRVDTKYAENFD